MESVLHRGIVPHPSLIAEEAHTFLQVPLRTQCESEKGKPVDHWREAAPYPILRRIESLSPCLRTSDAALESLGESAADSSQSSRTMHSSQPNSPCSLGTFPPQSFFVLPSQKIIEVALSPHQPPNAEDVRRHRLRIKLNVIVYPVPKITSIGKQIVHLIALLRIELERLYGQIDPARLSVMRIEVDHHYDDVGEICGRLAVDNQLIVVDRVKAQTPIAVQSGILMTYVVHARNQASETIGVINIPLPDLVFLRV